MNANPEQSTPQLVLPSPAIPLSGPIVVDPIVSEPPSLTTRESALEPLEGTTNATANGPNDRARWRYARLFEKREP
ncbi:hypothetical protein PM082_014206 [Marasmius tenuissimus]|nr:hypothetical protein PM082_014206 [Marasmius tenuissimus]